MISDNIKARLLLQGMKYCVTKIEIYHDIGEQFYNTGQHMGVFYCIDLGEPTFDDHPFFHIITTIDQYDDLVTGKAHLGGGHPYRGDLYFDPGWELLGDAPGLLINTFESEKYFK